MEKMEFSAIEKEMAAFNFDDLHTHVSNAKASISAAASAADITSSICNVWSKIRKFVVLAEAIPFIGKFVKILADLLDSFCNSSR